MKGKAKKQLQKQLNKWTADKSFKVKVKTKRSAKAKVGLAAAIGAAGMAATTMPKVSQSIRDFFSSRNQAKALGIMAKTAEKAQTQVEKIPEIIDLTDKPQVKEAVDKAGSALGELSSSLQQEARQRTHAGNGTAASSTRTPVHV